VVIGSAVWLGDGATVMSGVRIGHGASIGARAVVARDIPPYAIAVGNPAKVVRLCVTPHQREQLLRIAWWDWPREKVEKFAHLIDDVDKFIMEAMK